MLHQVCNSYFRSLAIFVAKCTHYIEQLVICLVYLNNVKVIFAECGSTEITTTSGTIIPPQLNGGFKYDLTCLWRIKVN